MPACGVDLAGSECAREWPLRPGKQPYPWGRGWGRGRVGRRGAEGALCRDLSAPLSRGQCRAGAWPSESAASCGPHRRLEDVVARGLRAGPLPPRVPAAL